MSQRISKTEGIAIARLVIAKVGLVPFLSAGISAIGATRLSAVLAGRDPGITLADAPAILAALDGLLTSKQAVEIVASVIGLIRTADLLADLEAVLATPADATRAWSRADSLIEAVMVTPLFVMRDGNQVTAQAKQIAASSRFNAVVSLVDLQSGRDYIAPGRTATDLTQLAKDNLRRVLDAGITPILIIRNDWAVRTKTGTIPSGNPANATDFYSAARLEQEKTFLNNLRGWFPFVHLQLSIEPEVNASAAFALALARHLRSIGYANRILINPIGNASGAHDKLATDLATAGVDFARSRNGTDFGRDPIINTDGNTAITAANFDRDWWPRLAADGREYIVWSKELANSPAALPAGYFATSATPGLTGSEQFLWKPISETTKKLVVLIPASISDKAATLTVNGERLPFASIANGNRAHFRSGKSGSAYGSNVDVTYVTPDGRRYAWRIPNGGARYTSTVKSGWNK